MHSDTFTVTNDITKYTKAKLFSEVGKKTDLFVRFSTVAGERGAADAERDIRGFAVITTPKKATGTSLVTTPRYSSFAIHCNSLI